MTEKSNIYTALLAARPDFERLELSGRNKHAGYAYATIDDVLATCVPALTSQGVVLTTTTTTHGVVDVGSTPHWHVTVHVKLTHAQSGTFIESDMEVMKRADQEMARSAGAALTYGMRYALIGLLALRTPTESDADEDEPRRTQRSDTSAAKAAVAAAPKPKPTVAQEKKLEVTEKPPEPPKTPAQAAAAVRAAINVMKLSQRSRYDEKINAMMLSGELTERDGAKLLDLVASRADALAFDAQGGM